MTFWTSDHFRDQRDRLVDPFNEDLVKDCAYELTLGPEAYVTSDQGVKTLLAQGQQFRIPPGQFALLLTEERLRLPNDVLGLISLRSKYKLRGLISVSGFHVDPGFRGRLVFSVYNAGGGDLLVSRGDSLFILWLAALESPTEDVYEGDRKDQDSISNEDIMLIGREQFSPAAMNARLLTLEERVSNWRNLSGALAVGLVLLFVQQLADDSPAVIAPNPAPTVTVEVTPTPTPDVPRSSPSE
jgi:dCTP deaminase